MGGRILLLEPLISYSLQCWHAHQSEGTCHGLLKCLDEGKAKNLEFLILEVNKRSLDFSIGVRVFVEISEGSGKAKGIFGKL